MCVGGLCGLLREVVRSVFVGPYVGWALMSDGSFHRCFRNKAAMIEAWLEVQCTRTR